VENNETDVSEVVKPLSLHLGLFVVSMALSFCYISYQPDAIVSSVRKLAPPTKHAS